MEDQKKYGMCKREVAELLRSHDINPTTQRIEIAHLIFQKAQHLCADEILAELNKEYEQVSQATVYNTLKVFVDKKVVRELVFAPDRIYYDSNTSHHHHFIDVDTGKIYDVSGDCVKCPELSYVDHLKAEVLEVSLILKGRMPQA
jgi:Fur family iron response transcriptional regulator